MTHKTNKKAQEEMVGFVLIMLVVAIIFLVFLGIYFRNSSSTSISEDKDISTFLSAASKVSVDCGHASDRPMTHLTSLMSDCNKNPTERCRTHPTEKCELLKDILKNLTETNWNFNENSTTKGYVLRIFSETSGDDEEIVATINNGLDTQNSRSAEIPLAGGLRMRLTIYY